MVDTSNEFILENHIGRYKLVALKVISTQPSLLSLIGAIELSTKENFLACRPYEIMRECLAHVLPTWMHFNTSRCLKFTNTCELGVIIYQNKRLKIDYKMIRI